MKILTVSLLCVLIELSRAKSGFGPGEQDWGYITVRPKAHMFWWLYYTAANDTPMYEQKPLIIWLQGGPGVSGTVYGNFEEFGPLDTDLKFRNHTWVKDYNVLIIDNPIGTGFSYVDSESALVSDNRQIAEDLITFLHKFLTLHPEFAESSTYILAESYGGKMTVEFAYLWYKGMIDDVYLEKINEAAERFVHASSEDDWTSAYRHASRVHGLIDECTSGVDLYNVLKRVEPGHESIKRSQHTLVDVPTLKFSYSEKLKKVMKIVKKELNLRTDWGAQEPLVSQALSLDSRKPVNVFVEKLLNETNIQVYVINGQLDLIINTPGVVSWIKKLNWENGTNWRLAPMKPLLVDNIIEGYSKTSGRLTLYSVLRSGHMVPAENPQAMELILQDLIPE